MKRFCEEEGYDYGKFLQYSRHGQKEYNVLKEADERQRESGGFILLVVDGSPDRGLGMRQRESEIHWLIIDKSLSVGKISLAFLLQKSKKMANLKEDMNVEAQLQAAYSTNAELRDQIDVLNRTVWSLEERLRISDESREDLKRFYENQMDALRNEQKERMDALRADQQKLIDAAVAQITKSFEEQIAKLIVERDAALLSAKRWRGKKYGRSSERNAGHDDDADGAGESRESEKADFVSPEDQAGKDAGKTSATTSDGETVDVAKEVAMLKRRHPGAEVRAERVDYSKVCRYMSDENVFMHPPP